MANKQWTPPDPKWIEEKTQELRDIKRALDAAVADAHSARGDAAMARIVLRERIAKTEDTMRRLRAVDPSHPFLVVAAEHVAEHRERLRGKPGDIAKPRQEACRRSATVPTVPEGSHVYFVQGNTGGPIKIGTSIDFADRLKTLQSSSPVKLVLLGIVRGDRRLERQLHKQLAASRLHGEWFADDESVRAAIAIELAKGAL